MHMQLHKNHREHAWVTRALQAAVQLSDAGHSPTLRGIRVPSIQNVQDLHEALPSYILKVAKPRAQARLRVK